MPKKKNANKSIFVSSTFRDMQSERDMLRDIVLPRVNAFAEKYGRAVEIIDLRWGVDTASVSEKEQSQKVLRTCLDEIERCRPFFLGLIGDRYGWTPPPGDMEAALDAAQFSLEDPNMSVTALEIEYGVLRSKNPPVCLFYFRESPDYAEMSDEYRQIYQGKTEDQARLTKLKDEIRGRFGQDVKPYDAEVHENELTVSKEWADMVAGDIIEKLREEWGEPSETPLDWREQERDAQEAFRESRTEHFAGRDDAIKKMVDFCLGKKATPQLLMIQGEAGSGKSGLLCKAMDEIEAKDKCLLLPFSCGISSRSSLVENMLRYFIFLLCEKLDVEDDSETITKFQDLKDRFIGLLFFADKKMWTVVVVVDALDQLFRSDEAKRMLWISGRLPENFRLLCSIIDGPETEAIKLLGGEVQDMPPISNEDEAAIIHGVATRQHKQIPGAVVEYILRKKTPDDTQFAAQNPLYLSLITQDLVMMNRYELDIVQKYMEGKVSQPEALARFMRERIDKTPGDPEGAYLAVLGRLEKLIGRDFVRGVCGMIAVSRSGLRESDLQGAFKTLGVGFNSADFSWLRQMLRGHISLGDVRQWDFAHQSLRRAIKREWPEEELKRLNDGIVEYFRGILAYDGFAVREIMHHLCAAGRPDIAAEVIAAYYNSNTALEQGLADVYTEHEDGSRFLLEVPKSAKNVEKTKLLLITENIRFVLPLLPESTSSFRIELMLAALAVIEKQEDIKTQRIKAAGENTVAGLYREIGKIGEASEHYQKAINLGERICEQMGTTFALMSLLYSYNNMGNHLSNLGKTEEASEYYQKSLDTMARVYEQSGTTLELMNLSSILYGNIGIHLRALGKTEEAGEYFQKKIDVCERVYELTGTMPALMSLSGAYDHMGTYLIALGKTEEVGKYYQKALDACKQVYEQTGTMEAFSNLAALYGNIGNHLESLGRIDEVGEYYQKELDACVQIYEQTGTMSAFGRLLISYNNIGKHLKALGKMEEACEYYQKAIETGEQIYKQTGTMDAYKKLLVVYSNMGVCMKALDKMEEAGEYCQKAIEAGEQIYEQTGTMDALSDLSMLYDNMGKHLMELDKTEEAGEYYRKSLRAGERIYEQTGTPEAYSKLSISYNSMGIYLSALDKTEKAGEYYQKALAVREQIYGQTNTMDALKYLAESYHNMGDHLSALDKTEEAIEYYQKALDARVRIYEQTDTTEALEYLPELYNKMGKHFARLGKTEEAIEYYQKALDARVRIYEKTGTTEAHSELSVSYRNMGIHLSALGRIEEAYEYYQEALRASLEIYEQTGTLKALRDLSKSHDAMGRCLAVLGNENDALVCLKEALGANSLIFKQGNPEALCDISQTYIFMGQMMINDVEESLACIQQAFNASLLFCKQTGSTSAFSQLIESCRDMGDHMKAAGKTNEANEYYQKALDIENECTRLSRL